MAQTKTMYHGEVRDMNNGGPVTIQQTGDVTPSKYKGRPPFVPMKINGTERLYVVENDNCAAVLKGRKGQTYSAMFEGSRDDAKITIVGQPGSTVQAPATGTQQAQQQAGASAPAQTQQATDSAVHAAKVFIGRRLTAQLITLAAVHTLAKRWAAAGLGELPGELLQSINASFFIAGDRSNMWDGLPTNATIDKDMKVHVVSQAATPAPAKCPKCGNPLATDGSCPTCIEMERQRQAQAKADDPGF